MPALRPQPASSHGLKNSVMRPIETPPATTATVRHQSAWPKSPRAATTTAPPRRSRERSTATVRRPPATSGRLRRAAPCHRPASVRPIRRCARCRAPSGTRWRGCATIVVLLPLSTRSTLLRVRTSGEAEGPEPRGTPGLGPVRSAWRLALAVEGGHLHFLSGRRPPRREAPRVRSRRGRRWTRGPRALQAPRSGGRAGELPGTCGRAVGFQWIRSTIETARCEAFRQCPGCGFDFGSGEGERSCSWGGLPLPARGAECLLRSVPLQLLHHGGQPTQRGPAVVCGCRGGSPSRREPAHVGRNRSAGDKREGAPSRCVDGQG
jgi:hypothetical protein